MWCLATHTFRIPIQLYPNFDAVKCEKVIDEIDTVGWNSLMELGSTNRNKPGSG